jgi:deoxyribonuclease V
LRQEIILENELQDIRLVAGADIAIDQTSGQAFAAIVVLDWGSMKVVSRAFGVAEISFPYVPGLLSFREGPVYLQAFHRLSLAPDVIIFDGQGIAHPRRVGIATHLGIFLDIPTIGCAKSRLVGQYIEPAKAKGSWTDLRDGDQRIGAVLRTRDNVRSVFVSPGHRVDLKSAIGIILACCRGYRLPEPTRKAHIEAANFKHRVLDGTDTLNLFGPTL